MEYLLLQIVVLGGRVGKTSLLRRYTHDHFQVQFVMIVWFLMSVLFAATFSPNDRVRRLVLHS